MVSAPKSRDGKLQKGYRLPFELVMDVERAALDRRVPACEFVAEALRRAVGACPEATRGDCTRG